MRAQEFCGLRGTAADRRGVCGGDGIGPTITHEAERVLRFL
ncbi:MAG: hypothetical protein ACLRRT_11545 [Ruthenibacterium lactatiformans]